MDIFCILQELSGFLYFIIGAIAKAVATVVTYPLQVIQSRLRVSGQLLYTQVCCLECAWGGARRSFVVRVFAHGVMGRRIDPSWGEPIELFLIPASAPRLVYKGCGMCYPLCGMMHIKEPLLLIGK